MAVLAGTDFFTLEVLTWRGWRHTTSCFSFTWKPGGSPSGASPATWLFGQPVRRRMSIQRRSIAFSTAGIPFIGGCLKFLESLAVL
jgi:hypothetical protein